jgi:hypothetical protein
MAEKTKTTVVIENHEQMIIRRTRHSFGVSLEPVHVPLKTLTAKRSSWGLSSATRDLCHKLRRRLQPAPRADSRKEQTK